MTTDELQVILSFLSGGALLGILGSWMDQLVSYIKQGD